MVCLPLVLALLPFLENLVKYQSPFRRPIMSAIYIFYVVYAIWLSLGSLVAITESLPLL
jgi:cytochrome b6-f complex subunit 4